MLFRSAALLLLVNRIAMRSDYRSLDSAGWRLAAGIPVLLLACTVAVVAAVARWPRPAMFALVVLVSIDMALFAYSAPWRSLQRPAAEVRATLGNDQEPLGTTIDAPGGVDRWFSGDRNQESSHEPSDVPAHRG